MVNLSADIVLLISLFAILIPSAIIDLRTQKIPNIITYSGMLAALSLQVATNGMGGLIFGLKGIAAGIALLIVPYLMGGMGAGDVKLMGAVGSFLGAKATLEAFIITAFVGGIYSLALILIRRDAFRRFFSEKLLALSSMVLLRQCAPIQTESSGQKPRLKYGVAIALGTITYLLTIAFEIKFFI